MTGVSTIGATASDEGSGTKGTGTGLAIGCIGGEAIPGPTDVPTFTAGASTGGTTTGATATAMTAVRWNVGASGSTGSGGRRSTAVASANGPAPSDGARAAPSGTSAAGIGASGTEGKRGSTSGEPTGSGEPCVDASADKSVDMSGEATGKVADRSTFAFAGSAAGGTSTDGTRGAENVNGCGAAGPGAGALERRSGGGGSLAPPMRTVLGSTRSVSGPDRGPETTLDCGIATGARSVG